MILVDTSVWTDYFNGVTNPQTDLLDASIVQGSVAIGDLIFLEILQDMAVKCADNDRVLRKRGITIRKTADVIIATFCIEKALPLLFLDRDFIPFVDRLGLEPALRGT